MGKNTTKLVFFIFVLCILVCLLFNNHNHVPKIKKGSTASALHSNGSYSSRELFDSVFFTMEDQKDWFNNSCGLTPMLPIRRPHCFCYCFSGDESAPRHLIPSWQFHSSSVLTERGAHSIESKSLRNRNCLYNFGDSQTSRSPESVSPSLLIGIIGVCLAYLVYCFPGEPAELIEAPLDGQHGEGGQVQAHPDDQHEESGGQIQVGQPKSPEYRRMVRSFLDHLPANQIVKIFCLGYPGGIPIYEGTVNCRIPDVGLCNIYLEMHWYLRYAVNPIGACGSIERLVAQGRSGYPWIGMLSIYYSDGDALHTKPPSLNLFGKVRYILITEPRENANRSFQSIIEQP